VTSPVAAREVTMSRESLEARMDRLEQRVRVLERLPERIVALEAQIVQLREDLRGEFSAMREEMHTLFDANETHMRVLHEDLVQRIATLKEGLE
jgi:predicted  nucleic acid-binding Zn-ribbon protein